MTRKATKPDFQRARRDNYIKHFESRQYVKNLPPELQEHYQEVSKRIIRPRLNNYGADSYTDEEWREIVTIANNAGVQAWFLQEWYVSEAGWQEFQRQWKALPEEFEPTPIDIAWISQRVKVP